MATEKKKAEGKVVRMKSFLSLIVCIALLGACAQPLQKKDSLSSTRNSVAIPSGEGDTPPLDPEVVRLCRDLDREIVKMGWKLPKCKAKQFRTLGQSVEGRPLVYREFGNPEADNATLILSMVHPDEVTPLYVTLKLSQWLDSNPEALEDKRVIVAPLINPDGFFKERRTRTNANGVDLNRNFFTRDWSTQALQSWKHKYSSNPRRYPGRKPESEPETLFQKALIEGIQPRKILSLHAPLNVVDYDGPNVLTLSRFPKDYVQECLKLRNQLNAITGRFFPGSLGNYAGQERGIPTITLELPTSKPRRGPRYWAIFRNGIKTVIEFEVPNQIADNAAIEPFQ